MVPYQPRTASPHQHEKPASAPVQRMRFLPLGLLMLAWLAIISLRLIVLQVIEHHHYELEAQHQQTHTYDIPPRRGAIYDRNLNPIGITIQVDSVYADPSEVPDKQQAAEMLASIVHRDDDPFTSRQEILARLNAGDRFAWIARKLDPDTSDRVHQLPLKGIYFKKEFKRFYPGNELAAPVVGYVGTDDTGLGGLELKFDDEMHGVPGHMLDAVDARRHPISSLEREPEPGEDLVLTIDQNIQFIAERALDASLAQNHALRGAVVVMDPHTGDILALATRPTYNPNDFRHVDHDLLVNRAVSDVYEPGSTFKLVTYSAALDSAGVKPDDIVDCQGGQINLYGRIIHDDKSDIGIGKVTVQRALEKSSDVGAVKMALKVGNEKFYDYIKAFGFGDRSGIELPAETRGLLRPVRRWDPASIGSLAIGQEVGVTPIQLAAMVSTIANGGIYLPPHILAGQRAIANGKLQAVPLHAGDGVPSPLPDGAHRVISEMTSAQMRHMMEGIVEEGTGKKAALNGYSSGGKTGTAQKIDVLTHTYSKTKHVASFAGIAPISNPAITVAVVIDSPQGASYYGGDVSAPVFTQIAQQTLEYMGVPYDREVHAVKSKQKPMLTADAPLPAEDQPSQHIGDQAALFAGLNDLPKDDPLRNVSAPVPPATATNSAAAAAATSPTSATVTVNMPAAAAKASVPSGMVAAPAVIGKPVRGAMETLLAVGLNLKAVGSGVARWQSPAPGAPIAPGATVQVRFAH